MTTRSVGESSRPSGGARRRLPAIGLASFALATAGLLLGATLNMAWLILFAIGVFGGPLLRETGLLRDRDEFQRQASRLAGQRAYLAGGVLLMIVTIVKSWGGRSLGGDTYSASGVLSVMLVVYLMSYLVSFWGAQRAAFRVLLVFGTFWMVFIVLSHATQPIALLMESLVAAPFFALAFISRRWPRVAGGLLLAVAACAFFRFDLYDVVRKEGSAIFVAALLLLPLLGSGIALLRAGAEPAD